MRTRKPPRKVRSKRRRTRRRLPRIRSRKNGVLAVIWAIVTASFTILWLTVGGVLWLLAAVFGGIAATMAAVAAATADDTVPAPAPSRSRSAPSRGKPRPVSSAPPCTNTARPIDVCGCSPRHVASADGARRYGRAIGAPLGGKAPRRSEGRSTANPRRPPTRKSSWYDSVPGTKCKTCKGSGAGTGPSGERSGACPTCRGFGKVGH